MTETKPFSLSRKDYTKIVFKIRLKKSWWLFLIVFIASLLHLKKFGQDTLSTFFVIFAFVYPIFSFLQLFFWVNSKDQDPIFLETNLSFDKEYIYMKRNGNESKISPFSFQKILTKDNYWMIYISKGQFVYIPKDIFNSKDDLNEFINLINSTN